jgi:hypothetical protein
VQLDYLEQPANQGKTEQVAGQVNCTPQNLIIPEGKTKLVNDKAIKLFSFNVLAYCTLSYLFGGNIGSIRSLIFGNFAKYYLRY